jgi:hypothetical protein
VRVHGQLSCNGTAQLLITDNEAERSATCLFVFTLCLMLACLVTGLDLLVMKWVLIKPHR